MDAIASPVLRLSALPDRLVLVQPALDPLGGGAPPRPPVAVPEGVGAPARLAVAAGMLRWEAPAGGWWWEVRLDGGTVTASSGGPLPAPPLVWWWDQHHDHVSVLGRMPAPGRVRLPALVHVAGCGSLRLESEASAEVGVDARRRAGRWLRLDLPGGGGDGRERSYRLTACLVHPPVPAGLDPATAAGFRRGFLDGIHLNPRLGLLANNSASDPVPFVLHKPAGIARHCPPLAPGLTAMDLVRESLDRYLFGALGYGMVGYGAARCLQGADLSGGWTSAHDALDLLPSLLIAAGLAGADDPAWADSRWDGIAAWVRALHALDRDGDGLIEYALSGDSGSWDGRARPANWWDTVGYGHIDGYSNALAYRALVLVAGLARRLGRDPAPCEQAAVRLQAAYLPALRAPSGLLAGWRSRDGALHDHQFVVVNAQAVAFGVVAGDHARALMQRLWRAFAEAGFRDFALGVPGNLRPIPRADYTHHEKRWGCGEREDGGDALGIYENGGATHCHALWLVQALRRAGLAAEADAVQAPLLASLAAGAFSGFDASGKSRDWKAWDGSCSGYEGFLADGYTAWLAPLDGSGE